MTPSVPPKCDRLRGSLAFAAGRWLSRTSVIKLAILALIIAAGIYLVVNPSPSWRRVQLQGLALAVVVYLAVVLHGRTRDAMAVIASLVFCLVAIEIYIVVADAPRIRDVTPSPTGPRPILGWGPRGPGVFHHTKIDTKTGHVVFDVDYTIDAHLFRQVFSAVDAPTVAFVGGSDTYGIGLPDAETLPQQFADATGRSLRVVNLAYPGYGPQQVLRALETGLFDEVLKQPKLFVIQVTPWQVERTSCVEAQMAGAPRYELIGGRLTFRGTCAESWPILVKALSEVSSIYRAFIAPTLQGARPDKLDLFVAVLVRAGEIAREKYGAAMLVIYRPDEPYLRPVGYTNERLMRRLRDGGLAVVDGELDPAAFPGQGLEIPGEGHPNLVANRAWAALVRTFVEENLPRSR